jgi:hypothetical protein
VAGEDPEHLDRIRAMGCCAPVGVTPCSGPVVAHHYPYGRGVAQKTHDHTAIPLCNTHHVEFHGSTGAFKHHGKAGKKDWNAEMVLRYQRLHHLETGLG